MSRKNKINRNSIRRKLNSVDKFFVCLYGSSYPSRFVKAYCKLHKCYLSAENIKEKGCNKKKCNYLKEIDTSAQPK